MTAIAHTTGARLTGEIVCTTPTVGANMEELTFQNVHFEARARASAS